MAARFPVSATSVAYQIAPAFASKIKAIFWPAGADALHMLRPGDTATTIVTRSTSGATYNAAEGRIDGTSDAPFAIEVSGGIGVAEDTAGLCFGASIYGDAFSYATSNDTCIVLSTDAGDPHGVFAATSLWVKSYGVRARINGAAAANITTPMANNTPSLVGYAIRHDQSDATAKFRVWQSENGAAGAEVTDFRKDPNAPGSSLAIGATGRPLYVGGTRTITETTKIDFESAWFAVGLTDSDLAILATNPADVIEEAAAGDPPDAPAIGSVTSITHNSATINWTDNSSDETGFKVEYGVSVAGTVSAWSAASSSPAAEDAESLGLTGLTPETTYKARVAATNASGDSSWVETAEFTTTVAPPSGPTIDTQPSNQSVTEPATATFTVAATASAGSLTYQWQVDDGGGWANVSTGTGGTTSSYTTAATVVADSGNLYRCVVTDSNGSVNSASATLTVNAAVVTKGVRIQLSAGAESLTGLSVRWWDDPTATGAPDYSADNETTDASGWLEIDLDAVTGLAVDALGYLLVHKSGATTADDDVAAGRVPIVDIA